jgi:uncharacterized protein (DUF1800 family)
MRFDEARHLLSRTSFGIRADEIEYMRHKSYKEAVEKILNRVQSTKTAAPELSTAASVIVPYRRLNAQQKEELKKRRRKEGRALKGWWFSRMVESRDQFGEWMTLFWHGHFTSELRKVKWPILLYRQNVLIRRHALGNFGRLLHEMAKDGAMMIYLDTIRNKKGHPNENFGRELLELFSLGEGHYSESDVKSAARAFTGWSLDRRKGTFRFRQRLHDDGIKRFLGQSGHFGGSDIIDIILKQKLITY